MSDQHDAIDWNIVARYLARTCTREEAETVARWAAAAPARRQELEILQVAWSYAAELPIARRASDAFPRFAAAAGITQTSARSAAGQPVARDRTARGSRGPLWTLDAPRRLPRWLATGAAIAASVALVVAAGWLWRDYTRSERLTRASVAGREFATARAQRASIELLDGTRAVLAPESRLRLAADFGAGHRVVDLVGKAYFVVTHDAKHPFVVRTSNAIAEDLGTTFVVRDYPGDSIAEVAVADGKVAVRARATEAGGLKVAVVRGEVAIAAASGSVAVTSGVDMSPYLGWTTGTLTFHKTPLREVKRELERWYGVRIELSDSSLAGIPVSASLGDEPPDQALRSLAMLLNVKYERTGALVRFIAESPQR